MASENYILLERTELNASAASVTFANIPQTGYTDLKLVWSTRTTAASTSGNDIISINGSSSSFTGRRLYGSGSSAASDTTTTWAGFNSANNGTASTFGNTEVYFPNYTASSNKSFSIDTVQEQNGTTAYSGLSAGLWSNTAAITSITLTPDSGSYAQYSTFSLYGIAAFGTTPVIAPKASGGNVIATDGTYWYHAFTSSGSFVPQVGLSCDVLVVAGGGGGGTRGNRGGGGGGAGGLLAYTAQSLTATAQTITVGAGGAASISGSNSQFASLTASVGGGRGSSDTGDGRTGGSGGGGYIDESGYAGTSGQGNAGGAGSVFSVGSNTYVAGGGGGASAAGNAGVTNGGAGGTNGKGGNGSTTYSSWGLATNTGQNVSGTVYYAGGGGGGSGTYVGTDGYASVGGFGGGGAGTGSTTSGVGTAGTVSTGGGGGGANSNTGGAGGSGIVIIRYPIAS
jgi:hypothetical protein